MTDLTKKNGKWEWGKQQQAKFEELKQKLATLTSIGVPRPKGEVILITDASDIGGGATLFNGKALKMNKFH